MTLRNPDTPEDLHRALIDWIVAHGSPMGVFGPSGELTADEYRTGLAERGIKYEESTVGDLGGESWSEDTYDESATVPGLWADVVGKHQRDDARWFVPGEKYTLTEIILDILTATDPAATSEPTVPCDERHHARIAEQGACGKCGGVN